MKLKKQKSIVVKTKSKTNQKETAAQKLDKYVSEFDQIYKLIDLDGKDVAIIPSYQGLKTSYQKKSVKLKKKMQNDTKLQNGIVGLKNMGNTCYINSTIQLLSNLQPLCDYFQDTFQLKEINRQNPLSTKGRCVVALANLLKSIWQLDAQKLTPAGIPVIIPEEFLKIVQHCSGIFGQKNQEDAQEFLMYLLDKIHEDLNRVKYPPPEIDIKEYECVQDVVELEKIAAQSWGEYLMRGKSVIIDLMQGQIKNSLYCNECKFEQFRFEPLMYLSLPIPDRQNVKLIDCIREYLKDEELSQDNQWFCEKCDKKVDSKKKIDLWKLPTILLIHLKRFKYTDKGYVKSDQPVQFPIDTLNLSNELPKLQKEKPLYELLGVVQHSGTINKGHYYTFSRSRDFKWYLFNDKQVKEVNVKDINSENTYLLMYGKSTIPLVKRQTLSYPDNWPHVYQ
ncbi:hypothetical protein pb186bvf_020747 [Paramecium bursaria]